MHSRGSNGAKGRWAVGLCAAMVAVTAAACAGETECEYANEVPTGDVNADITRCWQGIGAVELGQDPAFLVVYDFRPPPAEGETGFFREVQSPNRLYASGQTFEYGFFVASDGGTPVLDMGPELPLAIPTITETSLVLEWLFPTSEEGSFAVLRQPLRRARACTGYGFDSPELQCQPIRE